MVYMGLSSSLSQDNPKMEWDLYGIYISWDFQFWFSSCFFFPVMFGSFLGTSWRSEQKKLCLLIWFSKGKVLKIISCQWETTQNHMILVIVLLFCIFLMLEFTYTRRLVAVQVTISGITTAQSTPAAWTRRFLDTSPTQHLEGKPKKNICKYCPLWLWLSCD